MFHGDRTMRFPPRSAVALGLIGTAAFAADGLRFDSPGVLDLSKRPSQAIAGREVPVGALSVADAAAILAAPSQDESTGPLAFSGDMFGCSESDRACTKRHEDELITKEGRSVYRGRGRLVIVPESAPSVTFVDTMVPATKVADGDATRHIYLGRIAGSGYHRVEVQFDHDSPGSFLIAGNSGKSAFVHNGSDVVALAPTGDRIVVFNTIEMPLALVVAQLGGWPVIELRCSAAPAVTASFRGWHGDAFDLALTKGQLSYAVRLARDETGWSVAGGTALTGFSCRRMD